MQNVFAKSRVCIDYLCEQPCYPSFRLGRPWNSPSWQFQLYSSVCYSWKFPHEGSRPCSFCSICRWCLIGPLFRGCDSHVLAFSCPFESSSPLLPCITLVTVVSIRYYLLAHSGELRTQKVTFPLLGIQRSKVLLLKPSSFLNLPSRSIHLHFSQNPLPSFSCISCD